MQVAAELVSIAITLVLLLLTSAITVTADEVGQHIHQQRILNTWMVDDAGCHETMLSNSPFVPNITLVQGIVFSLRSTSASSVSSISVYLDEAAITPSVQFDLFTMNGDGTNSIGTTLDGSGDWKRIHGGTIADTQLDEDGATFLGSFGNPISLGAGDVKSFYLSFTKSIIRVSPYSANTADAWDANAISLNGHSMQISVGRAAIVWSSAIEPSNVEFYTPSIIPCKVWTRESCPPIFAPTLSPTTTSSPTTTRIIETVTIVNNTIDLFFETKSVRNGEACSVDGAIVYPLLADSLEEVSMKAYEEDPIGTTKMLSISITFHTHEDASPKGDNCSVVRFYYDAQIQYKIAENDETPPIELILLPLSTDSRRGQFLSTLNNNANGNPFFSSLSSIGPVVVTQEGLRTRSPTISPTKSASPTAAPSISSHPTAQPSASPTRSHMPSSAPIIFPSSQPSFSPSVSAAPTTEFNHFSVDFEFFISYPSSKEKQVEDDLLGNMTLAFNNRFSRSSDNVLSDFHNDPQVMFGIDETEPQTVQKIIGAKESDCRQGNAIATEFNVCEKYIVIMWFQHLRKKIKSSSLLKHYVRMSSKSIAKELSISYDGDDSVMKELLLIVSNADGKPKDEGAFCNGFQEQLQAATPKFNITEVLCKNFDFEVNDGGLRKLQEGGLGKLTLEYTVIAEYRATDGNDPNDLGKLVEDSINADSGKKVMSSLAERGLLSGKDMEAETREVVPPAPSQATLPQEETGGSQTVLKATVIIVCVFVVFTAAFFFYKAIQRIKVINEDPFYDYDVDGTMKPDKVYPEVYQDTSDDEPEVEKLPDDQASVEVAVVSPVSPNQPIRSMSREVVDRQGSLARLSVFESRLRQKADTERSSSQDKGLVQSESNSSLESFERRLRNKAGESSSMLRHAGSNSSLDSFEERLRRKTESKSRLTLSRSNSSLESFERRLKDKTAGSSSKMRLAESTSSLDSFDDRLKRKTNEGNDRLRHSESNSSLESFEQRLRKKAGESSSELRQADNSSSLDSFEERLRRKTESNSQGRHGDSSSSLESFEQRLRRKTEANSGRTLTDSYSSPESFEDRLKRKASEQTATTTSFESRLHQKLRGESLQNSGSSFEERLRQKTESNSQGRHGDSSSSLESFEQRLRRKTEANSGRTLTDSYSSPESFEDRLKRKASEQTATTTSFESRLHQKLRGESLQNSSCKSGAESVSTRAMDSFQKRFAEKISVGSVDSRSRSVSPLSPSFDDRLRNKLSSDRSSNQSGTFEERLQRKVSEENRSSERLSSQRCMRVVPLTQSPSTFEERLQRKLTDENRLSSRSFESVSVPSKQLTSTFEERLQKKLSDESRPSSKTSDERFQDVYQRARSLSKTQLEKKDSENSMDSFEKRLQRKLTDENRLSAVKRNAFDKGSSRSITSNHSSLSFEERLQKKLIDESRPSPKSNDER